MTTVETKQHNLQKDVIIKYSEQFYTHNAILNKVFMYKLDYDQHNMCYMKPIKLNPYTVYELTFYTNDIPTMINFTEPSNTIKMVQEGNTIRTTLDTNPTKMDPIDLQMAFKNPKADTPDEWYSQTLPRLIYQFKYDNTYTKLTWVKGVKQQDVIINPITNGFENYIVKVADEANLGNNFCGDYWTASPQKMEFKMQTDKTLTISTSANLDSSATFDNTQIVFQYLIASNHTDIFNNTLVKLDLKNQRPPKTHAELPDNAKAILTKGTRYHMIVGVYNWMSFNGLFTVFIQYSIEFN